MGLLAKHMASQKAEVRTDGENLQLLNKSQLTMQGAPQFFKGSCMEVHASFIKLRFLQVP